MSRSRWQTNLYYSLLKALLLPRQLLRDVRTRLTLVAGLLIVSVVTLAMYLTASHAASLVRRETQLAMSNLAVTVLNSVASQPQAPPLVHERFLRSMVNAKLEDEVFAVDILFALLQDGRGVVTALAVDETAALEAGWSSTGDRARQVAALQAFAANPALAARHGVIVVEASLESSQPSLSVILGCRRQAAGYVTSQIIARHVAVGVLIALTALLSLWVVLGHATRPIRQVFEAVSHISNGRLSHPILARERDEVGRVAAAVDQIRGALARGRQWQDLALNLLCATELPLSRLAPQAVCLAIPLQERCAVESAGISEMLEIIMAHEGTVEGVAHRHLLASWGRLGPEQDDLLRAVVAGLELSELVSQSYGQARWPAIVVDPASALQNHELPDCGESPDGPVVAVWIASAARAGLSVALAAGDLVAVGEMKGAWQAITWGREEPE